MGGNKKLRIRLIVVHVLIVAFGSLFVTLEGLQPLERALLGYNMSQSMSHEPHEDIIVVGIDQASLEEIGRFPWDRSVYVPFLDRLNQPENAPKAIAFDITFSSESDPDNDQLLADTLAKYDNVIFPVIANLENELTRTTRVHANERIRAIELEKPYSQIAENVELAHINALLDPDSVIRRTWLELDSPEGTIPSLAYRAAEMSGADVQHYLDYHPQAELVIDFQGTSYDFLTVSFASVLNGEFPLENFKDAIVLVGFTAVGFEWDNGATPVEKEMKLVYVHANIINQLLQHSVITIVPDWVIVIAAILLVGLAMYVTWRTKTMSGILILAGTILVVLAGQFMLYKNGQVYLDSVHPLAVMIFAYMMNISIKSVHESRQKQFITKQFGRYISPDLVKEIASSEQDIQLGGMMKELSILFLDIRGFTSVSERMKPEEVVGFLNKMFNLITEKTLENKGTVDKFIGDAAMLIFNAPLDVPDHALRAVKTACDIQRGMQKVSEEIFEEYGVEVNVGIGINTGEVVVGNVGSYLRVDYTAIGDNVNIASRIESQTAAGQIFVSQTTYDLTKDSFMYEDAGSFQLKGKSADIQLYEVKYQETFKE